MSRFSSLAALLLLCVAGTDPLTAGNDTPLSPGFTYQGLLDLNGTAVTGTCDFQFSLRDQLAGGGQIGATQAVNAVTVERGTFTVTLDDSSQFGPSPFKGAERYLEIAVRCPAGAGAFTTLSPRQRLTAVPYARYSLSTEAILGQPISFEIPASGDVLQWNGTEWAPTALAPRRYYQTSATVAGNAALTACASGFHMASMFEILNMSVLRYDASVPGAATAQDSGQGPPASLTGWIRTGVSSNGSTQVGAANCLLWTTNSAASSGTTVGLNPSWLNAANNISPWDGLAAACNLAKRVWCVEN